jgi:hypothetical protein
MNTLRKRLAKFKVDTEARQFRPELAKFATKTLTTCIATTPVRSVSTITQNQRTEYKRRLNYIPSVHNIVDPSLIVTESGAHMLFHAGRWQRADDRKLSSSAWSHYQTLLTEHRRRASRIGEQSFVSERAQARFLYRKSWTQCAESLGLRVSASSDVKKSHSRRAPRVEPRRGSGQWHGGKTVISVSIQNPFLEEPSQYKTFSGKAILAAAQAKHRTEFNRDVKNKVRKAIAHARRIR